MAKKEKELLRFDSRIYPATALKKACQAYAAFGDLRISKKGRYFVVSFATGEPAGKVPLMDEFKNYCLGSLCQCF